MKKNYSDLSDKEYKLLKVISYKLQNKKRLVINEFTLARIIDVSPDKIYWYLKRLKRLGYIKLYKRVMFKNIITYCEILNRDDVKIFKRKDQDWLVLSSFNLIPLIYIIYINIIYLI